MSSSSRLGSRDPQHGPQLRLQLAAGRPRAGVLHGAWWPHGRDALPELVSLIEAINDRVGQVLRIGLNHSSWDTHPARVVMGEHIIKLAWYGPADVHSISLTGAFRDSVDLLVIPPAASPEAAAEAMAAASDPACQLRASAVLLAANIDTAPVRPRRQAQAAPPAAAKTSAAEPTSARLHLVKDESDSETGETS